MDKIYLVVGGEYSDWYIEGYFTDREEAEKYCAIKNHKYFQYSGRLYIEEVENLTNKIEIKGTKLLYTHTVVFDYDKNKNSWIIRNEPNRYSFELQKDSTTFFELKNVVRDGRKLFKQPWISIDITALKGQEDRKKVEKIAQDKLYQYLAFEENF